MRKKKRAKGARKVKIKDLTGKMMVARRIKIGDLGVVCTLEHCGRDAPPAYTEGGIIYLNQDHSLYKKQNKKGKDNLSFFLGFLISQQISLMFVEDDPYKAFEIQNKLLEDSF